MAKVFLSYAREDAAAAKQLAECIGGAGHEVWWDRHIQGGSRFATKSTASSRAPKRWSCCGRRPRSNRPGCRTKPRRDATRPAGPGQPRRQPSRRSDFASSIRSSSATGTATAIRDELGDLIEAIAKTAGNSAAAEARRRQPRRKPAPRPSVCVLPFVNMSGDPEQEYFSDGITEDIITDLSKVSALLVDRPQHRLHASRARSIDVKEVAQALGVSHVLEGSVRKAGDRVRITAQLIDGATGGHLWADRYDRDLTDIFAIQDEISKAIVAALQVKLLPEEKKAIETRGTSSVEAYNLYLMARQQWISGSYGDIRRDETIVRICKQAVTFDPNYAEAWALMALAQSQLRLWHGKDEDALPAAERALAINPDLAEAHCVKAQLLEEQGQQAEANEEIEIALRLDPESWEVNREAARLIFRQGRIPRSDPLFRKGGGADGYRLAQSVDADHLL